MGQNAGEVDAGGLKFKVIISYIEFKASSGTSDSASTTAIKLTFVVKETSTVVFSESVARRLPESYRCQPSVH